MGKYVYLVLIDTELYSSQTRVLGCYLTLKEALDHMAKITNITPVQHGVFGSFWQNKNAGLRYYLRKFALGSHQKLDTTHRGEIVNLETEA